MDEMSIGYAKKEQQDRISIKNNIYICKVEQFAICELRI